MAALPEELLYNDWFYDKTEIQRTYLIKRIFDPDDDKSDAYLRRKRKYFVDQVITTNPTCMVHWGSSKKLDMLFKTYYGDLSRSSLRRWATARQYKFDEAQQLELDL